MKKEPSELQEQIAGVTWARNRNIFICSIENSLHFPFDEFKRFGAIVFEAAKKLVFRLVQQRKAAGQEEGMPDLFLPELFHFIETKKRFSGKASEVQLRVHEILRKAGYTVDIAHGAKEIAESVRRKYELVNKKPLQ